MKNVSVISKAMFVVLAFVLLAVPALAGGDPLQGIDLQGLGWATSWGNSGLLTTGYVSQDWYHVYQINMSTGVNTHLFKGANATWDPSGTKVAYWEDLGTLNSHYFSEFSLSIYDVAAGTSSRTGVVTTDFQSRINWANDNKVRFTWAEEYTSAFGAYWTEGSSGSQWTKSGGGGAYDIMDPWFTPDGIMFGRKNIGIQRRNFDGTIATIAWQPNSLLAVRSASVWNGEVIFADAENTYRQDGSILFEGTKPVFDPTGRMVALSDTNGWRVEAMPSVPEPGSLLALLTGLASLGGIAFRRRS